MIIKKVNRDQLIVYAGNLFYSNGKNLSVEEIDNQLIWFCLNCPDPGAAMDLILEAPQGVKPEDVVDQALAMPVRDVSTWSEDELSMDHPLRHWKLEV
jgi:hypothetical protein